MNKLFDKESITHHANDTIPSETRQKKSVSHVESNFSPTFQNSSRPDEKGAITVILRESSNLIRCPSHSQRESHERERERESLPRRRE